MSGSSLTGPSETTGNSGRMAIRKQREALKPRPHLFDYERECASFSWDKARRCSTGCRMARTQYRA